MSLTLIDIESLLHKEQLKIEGSFDEINSAIEKVVEHAYKSACMEHTDMTHTEANQAWLSYKATL
jgi:hypothetical protein